MTTPDGLTVAVISRNEAHLLGPCLERVTWADELLVLDMESTDTTTEVAAQFGATVIPVPLVPIAERVRQIGLDAARHPWILYLDPDERAPVEMEHVWHAAVAVPGCAAVRWRLVDVSFGTPTPHLSRGASKLVLFRQGRVRFAADAPAHSQPEVDGVVVDGPPHPVEHHGLRSVPQAVEKLMRYASSGTVLEADLACGDLALPRLWLRYAVRTGAWRDGPAGLRAAGLLTLHDYVGSLVRHEAAGGAERPLSRSTRLGLAAVERAAAGAARVSSGLRAHGRR